MTKIELPKEEIAKILDNDYFEDLEKLQKVCLFMADKLKILEVENKIYKNLITEGSTEWKKKYEKLKESCNCQEKDTLDDYWA